MIGPEDRLRARADEIGTRLDAIDADANAREGENAGIHSEEESQEYEKLTTELEGIGVKMQTVGRARKARAADWLKRRGLKQPGDLADGATIDTDDGTRITAD